MTAPSPRRARTRSRRRRAVTSVVASASLCAVFALSGGGVAQAMVDQDFELDTGDAGGNTAVDAGGVDWETLFTGPGDIAPKLGLPQNYLASGGRADYALPDLTTYATGSKDTLPIQGGWQCTKSNNVGDKVDIVNSYATAYVDADGDLILYYGVEKSSPNGDSNIAVWFLKDGTVDCTAGKGATDFTGQHTDGDILLVSEFSNGGTKANVNAYRWVGTDEDGALDPKPLETGQLCTSAGVGDGACSVVNKQPLNTTWNSPDKNGGDLDVNEFFEGGVNVGKAGAENCFATALANTRSSTTLGSTLFDYNRFSLPICGDLEISKYIDVDLSGTNDGVMGGDIVSGSAVTGWAFTVAGPAPSSDVRCSGTTNATGTLVCTTGSLAGLPPGSYTVTETQKTGFFNTDAAVGTGPAVVNRDATVSSVVTLGIGGDEYAFGNTCYVDKTFSITTVPTGGQAPQSMTVAYSVNDGPETTLALAASADPATWSGTVADSLLQSDTIDWNWYIDGVSTSSVVGGTDVSLTGGAFPACAVSSSDTFDLATVTGFKYKDADNNGDFNAGDLNGAGFRFQLRSGDTVLQTATSDANGIYTFANVAPGTYTVREIQETGWVQTEPAGNADRSVTVTLGQTTATIDDFGNTPLSDISLTFSNQAVNPGTTVPATEAQVLSCDDGTGSRTGNTYSATSLPVGTYTCTVKIIDP